MWGNQEVFDKLALKDPARPGTIWLVCECAVGQLLRLQLQVRAQYVQIYMEEVYDLLVAPSRGAARGGVPGQRLRIRDHKTFGFYVEGEPVASCRPLAHMSQV